MCQRPSYCAVCDRYLVVFPRLGSMLHLTREKHQKYQKHLTIAIDRDGHLKQEKSNCILETPSNHESQPRLARGLSTNFLDLPPELRVEVYKYYMSQNASCGHHPEIMFRGRHITLRGIKTLALLYVNRTIYNEFLDIAYSCLTFRLTICTYPCKSGYSFLYDNPRYGATPLNIFTHWPHFQTFLKNVHVDICEKSISTLEKSRGEDIGWFTRHESSSPHPYIPYIASLATWLRTIPTLETLQVDVELVQRFRFRWRRKQPEKVYLEWIHEWMSPLLDLKDLVRGRIRHRRGRFGFTLFYVPPGLEGKKYFGRLVQQESRDIGAVWRGVLEERGGADCAAMEVRSSK